MDETTNLSELSESVLLSVKKLIGISEDDVSFDLDIMLHINSAISRLYQLGVVMIPYTITSSSDTYSDLFPMATDDVINQVKIYFVHKTKVGFDVGTMTSYVITAINEQIKELEWCLMASANPPDTFSE